LVQAGIRHDESAGTWLIETRSTSYAFGLAGGGSVLRHLHWGPRVGLDAVAGMLATAGQPSWERRLTWSDATADEYVPWGGMRYDEPSLKADYADGTRAVEWRFAGQRIQRDGDAITLEADLADAAYGLEVTLFYRAHDNFDVLERWARIRHHGQDPVVLQQALSANWWLPPRAGWRLRYLHGGWGDETQLAESRLGPAKLVLESRRGTTSHQLNPWFTLDPGGAATEESGEVWSGELAWSGSWKLVFETTPAGRVGACGGWNDFDWAHRLAPGEEVTLPVFAGLYTDGGFGAASRQWHARQPGSGRTSCRGLPCQGWPRRPWRKHRHPARSRPASRRSGRCCTTRGRPRRSRSVRTARRTWRAWPRASARNASSSMTAGSPAAITTVRD
jgi:alpha-galactosidase